MTVWRSVPKAIAALAAAVVLVVRGRGFPALAAAPGSGPAGRGSRSRSPRRVSRSRFLVEADRVTGSVSTLLVRVHSSRQC